MRKHIHFLPGVLFAFIVTLLAGCNMAVNDGDFVVPGQAEYPTFSAGSVLMYTQEGPAGEKDYCHYCYEFTDQTNGTFYYYITGASLCTATSSFTYDPKSGRVHLEKETWPAFLFKTDGTFYLSFKLEKNSGTGLYGLWRSSGSGTSMTADIKSNGQISLTQTPSSGTGEMKGSFTIHEGWLDVNLKDFLGQPINEILPNALYYSSNGLFASPTKLTQLPSLPEDMPPVQNP